MRVTTDPPAGILQHSERLRHGYSSTILMECILDVFYDMCRVTSLSGNGCEDGRERVGQQRKEDMFKILALEVGLGGV